jgi:transcriptional repressor NrdR
MKCPFCSASDSSVKDSRMSEDESTIKRRRVCAACGARFTTFERVELRHLMVKKRDGSLEPFIREKLMHSIQTALRKRPVDSNQIDKLLNSLIRQFETRGEAEITTKNIGNMVLSSLATVDIVAYIRFASVYQDFTSLDDFTSFIQELEGQKG